MADLRWVRANIAAFGGDPVAVVVGDLSARAVPVSNLVASPLARGLLRGAVAGRLRHRAINPTAA